MSCKIFQSYKTEGFKLGNVKLETYNPHEKTAIRFSAYCNNVFCRYITEDELLNPTHENTTRMIMAFTKANWEFSDIVAVLDMLKFIRAQEK
ncbi:MAG: hypothetical protein JWP44_4393 [Mucilaginibacter sp.]|nr:hypothetical protein [Mucilaginibacter sp.]